MGPSWFLSRILEGSAQAGQARSLLEDAQALLEELSVSGALRARAVWQVFPANREGEDLVVWQDETRTTPRATLHGLRQEHTRDAPNRSIVDFVRPMSAGEDWVGAFVVQAGDGLAALVEDAEMRGDDYRAILLKAVADRLAEASAEWVHREARVNSWGYAANESLSTEDLLKESYQGIRPAPGYPAQPDHTEKTTIVELLNAEEAIGVRLTESMAMWPAASVSNLMFGHADAAYFAVGALSQRVVYTRSERAGRWRSRSAGSLQISITMLPIEHSWR